MEVVSGSAIVAAEKSSATPKKSRVMSVFHGDILGRILSFSGGQAQLNVIEVSGTIFHNVVARSYFPLKKYVEAVQGRVSKVVIRDALRELQGELEEVDPNTVWDERVMSQFQDRIVRVLSNEPVSLLAKLAECPAPLPCVRIAILTNRAQEMVALRPELERRGEMHAWNRHNDYCREGFKLFKQKGKAGLAHFCAKNLPTPLEIVQSFASMGDYNSVYTHIRDMDQKSLEFYADSLTSYLSPIAQRLVEEKKYHQAMSVIVVIPKAAYRAERLMEYARSLFENPDRRRASRILAGLEVGPGKTQLFLDLGREDAAISYLPNIGSSDIRFLCMALICFNIVLTDEPKARAIEATIGNVLMRDRFRVYLSSFIISNS